MNWKDGDEVIIVPAVSDEAARGEVPGRLEGPKPYLRLVAQPGK